MYINDTCKMNTYYFAFEYVFNYFDFPVISSLSKKS